MRNMANSGGITGSILSKHLTFRWGIIFAGLLVVIVEPFLIFGNVLMAYTKTLLSSDSLPIISSMIIISMLAFDVLLPIPSSLVNTAAGALLGLIPATITCWIGMTAGCIFGYWVGATGGRKAINSFLGEQQLEKAMDITSRIGVATLILCRAVPVLAEATSISAGAAAFPFQWYIIITGLANLGISVTYSAIGVFAFQVNSFLFAFVGALIVPALGILIARVLPKLVSLLK